MIRLEFIFKKMFRVTATEIVRNLKRKLQPIYNKRTFASNGNKTALTKDRYLIKRGNFNSPTVQDIAYFESICGPNRVITTDTDKYNVDFLSSVRGYSKIILKPKATQEVAEILRHCNERKLAVCPQGGNTGLVGGSVPVFDEIVISLELLNKIEQIDETSGLIVCESGCVLETLEDRAAENNLRIPIDMGARGSCQIGGNLSTNAGGLRLLRYGNLHGNVLGIEVVKADGTILNLMSTLRKDNTGYHLKHLFIGSEGSLGVITKVALACPPASKSVNLAFLGLRNYESVLKVFLDAKQELGEILSACEMIDADSLDCSVTVLKSKPPIEGHQFYMLLETSGSNAEHDEEKLNKFLGSIMEKGFVQDGITSGEPSKMRYIWELREQIASSILHDGYCHKYDISLPLQHFYDIVPVMKARCGHLAKRVCGYGHIGDSNLHLNISCEQFSPELYKLIEPFVYQYTSQLHGSVSAEHGIGFLKTQYVQYSKSSEAITLMQQMKVMLDPNRILNPYKVLPVQP